MARFLPRGAAPCASDSCLLGTEVEGGTWHGSSIVALQEIELASLTLRSPPRGVLIGSPERSVFLPKCLSIKDL